MGGSQSFQRVPISKDRIFIVTGGNAGIGYEAAKWIAFMGGTVIIACRNETKAIKAIEQMQDEFSKAKTSQTEGLVDYESLLVEYMELDCASLRSTMKFINSFKSSGRKLHALICNAGVAMPKQEYTEDGYELQFQVNYLSQFLIAAHALPIMISTEEDCRIILVSSDAHRFASFKLDEIQGKQFNDHTFDRFLYYGRSKLYQIMQMYSMNRRLKSSNVTVNCVHPGVVETGGVQTFEDITKWKIFLRFYKCIGAIKTPYQGAVTLVDAATNPARSDTRNNYFVDCNPKGVSSTARKEDEQEELWKYSLECLKEYLTDDIIACIEQQ